MGNDAVESSRTAETGIIQSNYMVAANFFVMSVAVSDIFQAALPGQFVMVRVKGREFPFLPRPFSIYSMSRDADATIIKILYQVVGKGTKVFSRLGSGDELTILGPLGKEFNVRHERRMITLIAGGIGIAPLHFLAEYYNNGDFHGEKKPRIVCFMGARTDGYLIGRDQMGRLCDTLLVSTDDGSEGYCGTVTNCFEDQIESMNMKDSVLYCCGPYPMMENLAGKLKKYPIPCQVSMEARMACGIGACLGCSIKMKTNNGTVRYRRVCKDGPVFDITSIDW